MGWLWFKLKNLQPVDWRLIIATLMEINRVLSWLRLILGVFLSFEAFAAFAGNVQNPSTNDLVSLVDNLPSFPVKDFLYDRLAEDRMVDPYGIKSLSAWQASQKVLPLLNRKDLYPTNIVIPLLTHSNPKVRTLALAALFAQEDAHLLPFIYVCAGDPEPTFDSYVPIQPEKQLKYNHDPWGETKKSQTVGDVASRMVSFYLQEASLDYWNFGRLTRQKYEAYWQSRGRRDWCASWFAVRLVRATQGSTPVLLNRQPLIQAIYQQIDHLPPLDRAWCQFWLLGMGLTNAESTLLQAGKTLGADRLMGLLQGKIDCADPDIQSTRREAMGNFVLAHATDLLRPDQAESVMQCAWREPIKLLAVVRLHPSRSPLLRQALAGPPPESRWSGDERAQLAAELWQLEGARELDFVLQWFYSERQDASTCPHSVASFLELIAAQTRSDNAQLAEAIIRHERFDVLDNQSLRALVSLCQRSARGSPLTISDEELYQYCNNSRTSVGLARLRNRLRSHVGLPEQTISLPPKPPVTQTPLVSLKLPFLVEEIRFSPDHHYMAGRTQDQDFLLWDCPGFKPVYQSERINRAFSMGFSTNGLALLTTGWRGDCICLCHWPLTNMAAGPNIIRFPAGITDWASTFSPDGMWVAFGGTGNRVTLCSAQSGQVDWQSKPENSSSIRVLAFSPDNQLLATGGTDCQVRLWDVKTGRLLHTLDRHSHFVEALAFSPDSRLLASGDDDDYIHLWECRTGQRRFALLGDNNYVCNVTFTPDGKAIAMNHFEDEIRFWSVKDGAPLTTIAYGSRTLNNKCLNFSADRQFIAVGNGDTIKILKQ